MSKGCDDPAKPFRGAEAARHNGHIGPGPKPGSKRAVNLSVDAEILGVAKDLKLNLSQVLEDELRKRTEDERVRRWREENKASIDSYNEFIKRHGTLAEAFYGRDAFDNDDPSV